MEREPKWSYTQWTRICYYQYVPLSWIWICIPWSFFWSDHLRRERDCPTFQVTIHSQSLHRFCFLAVTTHKSSAMQYHRKATLVATFIESHIKRYDVFRIGAKRTPHHTRLLSRSTGVHSLLISYFSLLRPLRLTISPVVSFPISSICAKQITWRENCTLIFESTVFPTKTLLHTDYNLSIN